MKKIVLYSHSVPLPDALVDAVHTGGYLGDVRVESEPGRIKRYIDRNECDLLICTNPDADIFRYHMAAAPDSTRILITALPMEQYSDKLANDEHNLLNHVISYCEGGYVTILEVISTIKKILSNDIFGIDKYLKGGSEIIDREVIGAFAREGLNAEVMEYANHHKLGNYRAKLAFGITEELLMNATYDALAVSGIEKYQNLREHPNTVLDPEHRPRLYYGCDGSIFAISVKDPFGLINNLTFNLYLKKVLSRNDSSKIIDTKKEGAGLGLFKILFSSHSLICNVENKKFTEMISIIDLSSKVKDFSRMTRSIHFFQKDI